MTGVDIATGAIFEILDYSVIENVCLSAASKETPDLSIAGDFLYGAIIINDESRIV